MKRAYLLAALNAVYFSTAAACAAWCVVVYGLSTVASYVAGITVCIYGLLAVASVLTLRPDKSPKAVAELSAGTRLFLRVTCLTLPLAFFTYTSCFYVVQSTYSWPGGVDRFEAFAMLENMLFHKDICTPSSSDSATKYVNGPFQAWAQKQWHGQDSKHSYAVVCRFNLLKDGSFEKTRIYKSSGDEKCDQSALAALDSIAPPMPADSPDRSAVEFTFTHVSAEDKWPVIRTDTVTPSQDQFLIDQGKRANDRSDFPRSKQLLLQCLEERRLRFKPGAPEITDVLRELADLYCRMGLLPQSHEYFDSAVANASLNKNHPQLLVETLRAYADQSFECSKFAKALSLYKRCFSLNSVALDRTAKLRLAETYYAAGDYDSAIKIFAEVVRLDEHSQSADILDSLDDERLSLCNQYIKAGHPKLACRLIDSYLSRYDKAKDLKSKNEHMNLLSVFQQVYKKLPDKVLGRRYEQSAFAELSTALDPLSSSARVFRSSLASTLWESGDKTGALELFEDLVAKYDRDTADRAYALFDQASFLFENEKYPETERAIREALSIRTRLYDRNDQRVTRLKFALAELLEIQKRSKEAAAVRDDIHVPANADCNDIFQASYSYQLSGQLEKALEILQVGIRDSYKGNPKDEGGARICLIDQAVRLCNKSHDYTRLEHLLNEKFQSETKRLGFTSRIELIQFYAERNQLAKAEDLANLEVTESVSSGESQWSKQQLATSFLLLAQIKYAQQRHQTAKYYVVRAIEAMQPYGRSSVHITAVGILAQLFAKDGDFKTAEKLLENLYNSELTDTDTPVCGDIVEGFNTTGCHFTAGYPNEANDQRYDATLRQKDVKDDDFNDSFFPAKGISRVPMIALNWTAACLSLHDFSLLQASTLEARARIQTLESKFREAADSRSLMFEHLEASIAKPSYYRDFTEIAEFLKEVPKSERQQKLLQRVRELQKR